MRSFSHQYYSQIIANNISENVSQVRTKIFKTRFFFCKVYLTVLSSSRQFGCDTALGVFVSLFNDGVQGLNNFRDGGVTTAAGLVEVWQSWEYFVNKQSSRCLCDYCYLDVWAFSEGATLIFAPDPVASVKSL